jgi:hypothetical protein
MRAGFFVTDEDIVRARMPLSQTTIGPQGLASFQVVMHASTVPTQQREAEPR